MSIFREIFFPEALGAVVRRFADQSANRNFIKVYEEGERILANVDGSFKYDEVRFSEDLAPITGMDSPSTSTAKPKVTKKVGTVVAIKTHSDLPARMLMSMNAPGANAPDAVRTLNAALQNNANRISATHNYWAAKSLLTQAGAVDLSAAPNAELLVGTETYPVLDIDAAAAWSTAGTKIRSSEINAMKKTYFQQNGFFPRRAKGSSKLDDYFAGNTELSGFLSGGSEAGRILARAFEAARGGDALLQLGGIAWEFVEDYYKLDSDADTAVSLFADLDVFALLPGAEMSQDVFGLVEGVEFIPADIEFSNVVGNPESMFTTQRGYYAFIERTTDPVGLRLHSGWVGYLVQKRPKAVAVVDTSP